MKLSNFQVFTISVLLAFGLQYQMMSNTLPYPGHVDEGALFSTAINIMKSGDFDPDFYQYPSLPIYLTTFGATVGFLQSASSLESKKLAEISSQTFPHFKQITVVKSAKALFLLFSSAVFGFLVLLVREFYPNDNRALLIRPILTVSEVYMGQSWTYLNPNIIATFFTFATLLFLLKSETDDSFLSKSIVPGILCAAATASKYNFGLLLVPSILAIIFYSNDRKILKSLILLSTMSLFFLVFVPYSLINFPAFIEDVAFEVWHYKAGHAGFDGQPGLRQLIFHMQNIVEQFSFFLILAGVIGVLSLFKNNARKLALISCFPVLLLFFMSMQTVNFLRNLVALYALISVFCCVGLFSILKGFGKLPSGKMKILSHAFLILCLTQPALLMAANFKRLFFQDSRNQAAAWLSQNGSEGVALYIAEDLEMSVDGLQELFDIRVFEKSDIQNLSLRSGDYIVAPVYRHNWRKPEAEETANQLNQAIDNLELDEVLSAGKNPVRVSYAVSVPRGDPQLRIAIRR